MFYFKVYVEVGMSYHGAYLSIRLSIKFDDYNY